MNDGKGGSGCSTTVAVFFLIFGVVGLGATLLVSQEDGDAAGEAVAVAEAVPEPEAVAAPGAVPAPETETEAVTETVTETETEAVTVTVTETVPVPEPATEPEAGGPPPRRSTGKLDRADIERGINRGLKKTDRCFEKALAKNPALRGRLVIEWTILGSGRVDEVRVQPEGFQSKSLVRCVKRKVKRWRFRAPEGGHVVVSYPIVFGPAARWQR